MNYRTSALTLMGIVGILLFGMLGMQWLPHTVILLAIVFVSIVAAWTGMVWNDIEDSMVEGVKQSLKAIFILGMIGMVIATWMWSGIIPTLFAYGLQLFSPQWFLPSSVLLCMAGSVLTGSSLTTGGTLGVALMGIGHGLGINPAWVAGAVVSGSLFGDKMSPLSDTTNFAPGVTGVDLFEHVKFMFGTTVPAVILTLIIFTLMSLGLDSPGTDQLGLLSAGLAEHFNLSLFCLIPIAVTLYMAVTRRPVLPTIAFATFLGLVTAGFTQGRWDMSEWGNLLYSGVNLDIADPALAKIVNRGGLESMMFSISLILLALMLGGLLQKTGIIQSLSKGLHSSKNWKRGPLVAMTTATGALVNLITGEMYLSILIPAQVFRGLFEKAKVPMRNLSRTLEDGGTLLNPLIPWGVSGTFFATALDVPVLDYMPFAFFCYLCPIFSITFAFAGRTAKPSAEPQAAYASA